MKSKIYQNKKLLILGATVSEISLVKRAQEFGIYVITTDYNTDYSLSPAKLISDEAWDISWSDIDELEKMCKLKEVNGIIAGYSEIRVEMMIKLCRRLNLYSYITEEQLEITRDKVKFKKECRKYKIPVVAEYNDINEVNKFPVIIKPTDRAGSIGISIANDKSELEKAYLYAMEKSISKEVIIEEYIYKSNKFDVYYAISDGEIELISSCDTIDAKENNFKRVIQSCWLYPSRHLNAFLKKIDYKLRNMIKGLKINYGCIFFSGFVDEKENFQFFECGFRLEGGNQYEYVKRKGKMNYLDLFINYALNGNTHNVIKYKETNSKLKCVTINFYSKKGIIKDIIGTEKILNNKDCTLALIMARTGEECNDENAILKKIGMFSFCNEISKNLERDVKSLYNMFFVKSMDDKDLIFDRIDTRQIANWWI